MIGTVRFNNIASVNWPPEKEASTMIKGKPRGTWYICQAYDVTHEGRSHRELVAKNLVFSYPKIERQQYSTRMT